MGCLRGVRESQGRAMEISDKVREDLKKVAFERFGKALLHDVRVRLSHDELGEECIKVTLVMDDGLTMDEMGGIVGINRAFIKVLDDDVQHLFPFWKIRTPEQMAQLDRMG